MLSSYQLAYRGDRGEFRCLVVRLWQGQRVPGVLLAQPRFGGCGACTGCEDLDLISSSALQNFNLQLPFPGELARLLANEAGRKFLSVHPIKAVSLCTESLSINWARKKAGGCCGQLSPKPAPASVSFSPVKLHFEQGLATGLPACKQEITVLAAMPGDVGCRMGTATLTPPERTDSDGVGLGEQGCLQKVSSKKKSAEKRCSEKICQAQQSRAVWQCQLQPPPSPSGYLLPHSLLVHLDYPVAHSQRKGDLDF